MKIFNTILILAIFYFPGFMQAQENGGFADVLPPPDLPERIQNGEEIEPEVTIIRKKESIEEEYRINGNLYMVKITPAIGPAYYLIDQDGDGSLEFRTGKLGGNSQVPQWILFSW